MKGRDVYSLKALSEHRHLLGVVVGASEGRGSGPRDSTVDACTAPHESKLSILVYNAFGAPSTGTSDNNKRSNNGISSSSSGNSSSGDTSRFLRIREEASYSVLPLVSLTTFTREWAALQSVTNQNLMLLTPYLLKASPVISATRLEYVGINVVIIFIIFYYII